MRQDWAADLSAPRRFPKHFFLGNSFVEIEFTCHWVYLFKVCNSVVSLYSQSCAAITTVDFRALSSPQKETHPHEQSPSIPSPAPDHQEPTLCVCGSACSALFPSVESHPVCPSVSASLTEHRVLRICPCGSKCQGFSPSRGQVTLPGVEGQPVFIHPSVGIRAVCTSRPVWLHVQPLCGHGSSCLLGGHPALGLLGPMETPVTLLRRQRPVPTQLHLSPPHPHRGVGLARTMVSRCVSLTVGEHLLPVGHLCFLFGEMSVQILCFFSFFFPSFFLLSVFFFFFFFLMWTILKSSLNLLQRGFCFMVWCLGHMVCRILVPRPGIKPTPPALEGEVLTTRRHQESPCLSSSWVGFHFIAEFRPSFYGLDRSASLGR